MYIKMSLNTCTLYGLSTRPITSVFTWLYLYQNSITVQYVAINALQVNIYFPLISLLSYKMYYYASLIFIQSRSLSYREFSSSDLIGLCPSLYTIQKIFPRAYRKSSFVKTDLVQARFDRSSDEPKWTHVWVVLIVSVFVTCMRL